MFRTIDRYILSESLPTFGISLAVFIFVLMIHRMVKLFDLVISKGVGMGEVLKLLALAVPAVLPFILPISLLLAVVLALGRISSDGEVVAMRSCGLGLGRTLRPVAFFSTGVMLLAAVVSLWAQPQGSKLFRSTLYETLMQKIDVSAEAGVFSTITEGITFFAEKVDHETGELEGLMLHSVKAPLSNSVIFAPRGRISSSDAGVVVELENASIYPMLEEGGKARRSFAEKSRITIPLPTQDIGKNRHEFREKDTRQLIDAGYGPQKNLDALMELHRRFSLPVSCLILGLLGGALGPHHSRTGKGRGLTLCFVVLFIYYALITAADTVGRRSGLPPELVMWLPNIILLTLFFYVFTVKNNERALPFVAPMVRVATWPVRLFSGERRST
jgi:lipopolysaccharide export system permease protein